LSSTERERESARAKKVENVRKRRRFAHGKDLVSDEDEVSYEQKVIQ